MKKNVLPVLALFLITTFASAQSNNKIGLSFGPELNIPFNTNSYYYGKIRDYYQDGIGGSLQIELPISSSLYFTGSAGFIYYPTNEHLVYYDMTAHYTGFTPQGVKPPSAPAYKFMPLKAGLQYYYSKYMYVGGEAGEAFKLNSASTNSFIYSGGLGGVIPFNVKSGLDIGVRYERGYKIQNYPSAMSQIAIRVAYKFMF